MKKELEWFDYIAMKRTCRKVERMKQDAVFFAKLLGFAGAFVLMMLLCLPKTVPLWMILAGAVLFTVFVGVYEVVFYETDK